MAERLDNVNRSGGHAMWLASRMTPFSSRESSGSKVFWSNLKDFLTEHPTKLPRNSRTDVFSNPPFGAGFGQNLKEFFRRAPDAAAPGSSKMLVDLKPWYRMFWEDVRDTVAPPKLPPLRVTSKPVKVRDIWSPNDQFKRAQVLSILWHALIAILILVPLMPKVMPQGVQASKPQIVPIDISPYLAKLPPGNKKAGGGGGGGEHNPVPASRGRLPKFSWTQYAPPMVKTPPTAKIQMPATVLGPPDIHLPSPNMPNYGDPLAKLITDSSGPGGGSGIGTGCCGGVGSGSGGGVGPGEGWGTGGGPPGAGGNGYGVPVCIYCPQPVYSDEAVKLKYQGAVVLRIVVNTEGKVTNTQVVKGIGVGLDEKAMETVKTWRLKPAIGPNGKPATVSVLVEVTYRLL